MSDCFLLLGDNRRTLRALPDNSIDAVVTDPPYGLGKEPDMAEVLKHWLAGDDFDATGGGFMGKSWDSFVPGPATWREVYRVLKPGGHVLAFSGTRTFDIAALAMRLAGFEIRDTLSWMYGSGFPKSMDISKAIDKAAGAEREVGPVDQSRSGGLIHQQGEYQTEAGWSAGNRKVTIDPPATDEAKQWEGWGTALKPAWEPIIMARKPVIGTIAANVLAHGTGALNIDATRIGYQSEADMRSATPQGAVTAKVGALAGGTQSDADRTEFDRPELKGRFPANLILSHTEDCVQVGVRDVPRSLIGADYKQTDNNVWVGRTGGNNSLQGGSKSLGKTTESQEVWECADECPIRMLDEQTGDRPVAKTPSTATGSESIFRPGQGGYQKQGTLHQDSGGASRFFYNAKTPKSERNAGMPEGAVNDHATVKPVAVMEWLIKLVTPPGGRVLDPFIGSGSTGVAAAKLGFRMVGCELDAHFVDIAKHRITHAGVVPEVLSLGTSS